MQLFRRIYPKNLGGGSIFLQLSIAGKAARFAEKIGMPELPEVQTVVNDLKKMIIGKTIADFWYDAPKIIKKPKPQEFGQKIKGLKIIGVKRLGKNIIINLTDNKILLIHQKMTGHLLYGKWKISGKKIIPLQTGPLKEKVNNYIHLLFIFSDGFMMGLSDLRKFAKVLLLDGADLNNLSEIKKLGPDALQIDLETLKEIFKKSNKKIKQVLMDQEKISGIGNIYSDEILWLAKIHPFKPASKLSLKETEKIFKAIPKILHQSLKHRGSSISDYRDPKGIKGRYDTIRKVYQKEGEKCPRCKTSIKRQKIGGRSAHFCPACQSL